MNEQQAEVCTFHHFPQQYEESRCSRCAIRRNYLNECLGMLYQWPKADQKSEEWRRKYDSLMKCSPHVHLPSQPVSEPTASKAASEQEGA